MDTLSHQRYLTCKGKVVPVLN